MDGLVRRGVLPVVATAMLVWGCVSGGPVGPADLPPRAAVTGVPFLADETMQGAPAALAAVLAWSGLVASPASLAERLPDDGDDRALRRALAAAAWRRGRLVYPVADPDVALREVAAGQPVIVPQRRSPLPVVPVRFAVLVGYDRGAGEVVLDMGGEGPRAVPYGRFVRDWRRAATAGMAVLPAGGLPGALERDAYLSAAADMAQVAPPWEGVEVYDGALSQWPDDPEALFGLGGELHALGDRRGAVEAYRRAARLADRPGPALGRLATVLTELSRAEPDGPEKALSAVGSAQ